jgi:hypothetical protein
VRCELIGEKVATVDGWLSVCADQPILEMSRLLVELGYPPGMAMVCFRRKKFCLSVSSIGQASLWQVNKAGTGFTRRQGPMAAALSARTKVKVLPFSKKPPLSLKFSETV